MSDLPERLREVCNGHPAAKINWPHRLLHDAADEIERLNALLEIVWNFPTYPVGHPGDRSEDAMCEDDWRHGWICAVSEIHEALRGEEER